MEEFIDSLGFKSLEKVYKSVKEKFPNVTKKIIKEYLDSNAVDKKSVVNQKIIKNRMGKSYSSYIGGWQMDIFIFKRKYYLLAIEMNSRYAYISKLIKSKATKDVLPEIKIFVEKFKPVSISCDNEASFTSSETINYLISRNVELRVITEQIHSSLGILNRFCRTLRDMEFQNKLSLEECVDIYNNSYHRIIKTKPITIHNDSELEEVYISRCIFENNLKLKKLHEEIKPGMKVRYVEENENKLKKIRYKLSPFYYLVDSIDNFKAVIIAKDGSSKTVPLYRISKLNSKETRIPFAETFEGTSRGVIDEMIDYNPKNKSAKVKFKLADGSFVIQTIPLRFIREQFPTRVSDIEMEFLMKNSDKFELKNRYLRQKGTD